MKEWITRWIVAIALPLLAATPAGANTLASGPSVSLDVTINEVAAPAIPNIATFESQTTPGTFDSGTATITIGSDIIQVVLCVKPDPYITSTFTITNGSSTTQTFSLLSILPVTPVIAAPTWMNGHISGTVTDNNSNGATVSTNGSNPLYQGWIDTGVVTTTALYSHPSSWGAGAIPLVSFAGLPGGAVATNIGIQLNFTLTAGDSVTLDSFFEVVPVPEPASAGLVAISCFGLAALRRRTA